MYEYGEVPPETDTSALPLLNVLQLTSTLLMVVEIIDGWYTTNGWNAELQPLLSLTD